MHSPMAEYLRQLSTNLSKLEIPVFFDLPDESYPEPFFVIGNHFDNDTNSPKYGKAIVDTQLQVDLFYPVADRAEFEDAVVQAKQAMQPALSIQVNTSKDSTTGRTLNRAQFQILNKII